MRKMSTLRCGVVGLCTLLCGCAGGASSGMGDAEAKAMRVQAAYDYGLHVEGKASMLYNACTRFFDLPESLDCVVAGDVFTIGFTGDSYRQETYPSTMKITHITSVEVEKAEIVRLMYYAPQDGELEYFMLQRDDGVSERITVSSRPDYVIETVLDGTFSALSDVSDCKILFGTYNAESDYSEETGYRFVGLYADNPRGEA